MKTKLLKQSLIALFLIMAMPLAKAQVRVGDILCDDNTVVSQAGFALSSHTAVGVVFYVDATGKHGWAIGLEDLGKYAWGPNSKDTRLRNFTDKQQAVNDRDGFSNTRRILEARYDIEFPAFDSVDIENGWYLPAIGQWKRLYANLDKVNAGLEAAGGTAFSTTTDWKYWSSTEYSVCNAWAIDSLGVLRYEDETFNGNKDARLFVRVAKNF